MSYFCEECLKGRAENSSSYNEVIFTECFNKMYPNLLLNFESLFSEQLDFFQT